jgi:hypothetical protein
MIDGEFLNRDMPQTQHIFLKIHGFEKSIWILTWFLTPM